jgi:UDP-N-acetylglucosamine:LPS N-acetylglucosamine transferase
MKVLFLPYYYYMQYEPFKLLIKEMISKGIDAYMLYIPNISPKDETQGYNPERFKNDGIPFVEFKLSRFALIERIFRPLSQIIRFFWNSHRMKKLIKKLQPDGVVIASHLGGIYVRYLQILCHKMSIPVISMWIIEASLINEKSAPKIFSLSPNLKNTLNWSPYNQYMSHHLFLATGNVLKEFLVNMGVNKEQIIVTGNPSHDEIYGRLNSEKSLFSEKSAESKKYIVLLTEVIHEVSGISYIKDLVEILRNAFDKLPSNIEVIVKFHPRETDETRGIFREGLSGKRCRFIENCDLVALLYGAEISIGHFTKALETSFIVGTPVLGINFSGDRKYSVYSEEDNPLECKTPAEFESKLLAYFTDESFQQQAEVALQNWSKKNIYAIDGSNTHRVVEAILSHINSSK